jgi:Na+/melibiose symporter-like transporter
LACRLSNACGGAVLGGLGVFLFASGNGAKTEGRRLDGIGALTCATGLLGLVLGIIQINHVGLLHPRVLESLAVGIGALTAFVWWERKARDPLLDITLFSDRIVSVAVTAGLLAALVIGGALLPLLYFLQTVQKVSPISPILRLMPLMVAAAAFAPVAGQLTAKIGPRKVIAAGLALMAAGSSLLILLTPETPYGQVLLALVLLGAGDIACNTTNVATSLPGFGFSGKPTAVSQMKSGLLLRFRISLLRSRQGNLLMLSKYLELLK